MTTRVQASNAAFYLVVAANVSVVFSIFVSQTVLGLAVAALLIGRSRLELPPPALPLALFSLWTLAALALSPRPALGLPQVKKFYIFLIVVAAYTVFRNAGQVHRVFRALFVAASAAALLAVIEFGVFYQKLHALHDFYSAYASARITGFMGHWQTFSGEQMLVLAVLLAYLLVGRPCPRWAWAAAAAITLSLLLAFTRGVWLGCLAAAVYLLWQVKRRWVWAVPAALVLAYFISPAWVQARIRSLADTRTDSSNQARVMMAQTGLNMIRQHPLFGVGPNGVSHYFDEYRPAGDKPQAWYGHLHSNYLQIAAERGLPALVFFLWMLLAALRDQGRLAARIAPEYRYIPLGISAAIVAVLVAGAFEYNFGDSEVAMLLLFYLSHGYSAAREPAAEASASEGGGSGPPGPSTSSDVPSLTKSMGNDPYGSPSSCTETGVSADNETREEFR